MILKLNNLEGLCNLISDKKYDMIIFVGYDCVGKNYIMEETRKMYKSITNVEPTIFNPEYTFVDKYVPLKYRWTYFMYALTVIKEMKVKYECPLLVNRSSLCGAVYNGDDSIFSEYIYQISNLNVLHVLVVCSYDQYKKNKKSREEEMTPDDVSKFYEYTNRYECYMKMLDRYNSKDCVIYYNMED